MRFLEFLFIVAAWMLFFPFTLVRASRVFHSRRVLRLLPGEVDKNLEDPHSHSAQISFVLDTLDLIQQGLLDPECRGIRIRLSGDNPTITTSHVPISLPYWIEGGCSTSHTLIWFRLDDFPAVSPHFLTEETEEEQQQLSLLLVLVETERECSLSECEELSWDDNDNGHFVQMFNPKSVVGDRDGDRADHQCPQGTQAVDELSAERRYLRVGSWWKNEDDEDDSSGYGVTGGSAEHTHGGRDCALQAQTDHVSLSGPVKGIEWKSREDGDYVVGVPAEHQHSLVVGSTVSSSSLPRFYGMIFCQAPKLVHSSRENVPEWIMFLSSPSSILEEFVRPYNGFPRGCLGESCRQDNWGVASGHTHIEYRARFDVIATQPQETRSVRVIAGKSIVPSYLHTHHTSHPVRMVSHARGTATPPFVSILSAVVPSSISLDVLSQVRSLQMVSSLPPLGYTAAEDLPNGRYVQQRFGNLDAVGGEEFHSHEIEWQGIAEGDLLGIQSGQVIRGAPSGPNMNFGDWNFRDEAETMRILDASGLAADSNLLRNRTLHQFDHTHTFGVSQYARSQKTLCRGSYLPPFYTVLFARRRKPDFAASWVGELQIVEGHLSETPTRKKSQPKPTFVFFVAFTTCACCSLSLISTIIFVAVEIRRDQKTRSELERRRFLRFKMSDGDSEEVSDETLASSGESGDHLFESGSSQDLGQEAAVLEDLKISEESSSVEEHYKSVVMTVNIV